jgi:hypothetical protein
MGNDENQSDKSNGAEPPSAFDRMMKAARGQRVKPEPKAEPRWDKAKRRRVSQDATSSAGLAFTR